MITFEQQIDYPTIDMRVGELVEKYSWLKNEYFKELHAIDPYATILKECIIEKDIQTQYGTDDRLNFEAFWSTIYRQLQIGKNIYAFVISFDKLTSELKPYFIGKCFLRLGFNREEVKNIRKRYRNNGIEQYTTAMNHVRDVVLYEVDQWMMSQWMNHPAIDNYKHTIKNGIIDKSNGRRHIRNSTNLKEFYYYRYRNEAIVLTKNKNDIENILIAFQRYIGKRFGHQFDGLFDVKYQNLTKNHVDILGYRLRLSKKNKKYIVKSSISNELLTHYDKTLKKELKKFLRGGSVRFHHSILTYNKYVMTLHSYYKFATNVSIDLSKIHYHMMHMLRSKSKSRNRNITKQGEITTQSIKHYQKSDSLRFVKSSGQPILPVGYVKFKKPMFKRKL